MKRYKNNTFFLLIFTIVVLSFSCVTYSYDRTNPYPNMKIMRYANSQAYVLTNKTSDKLIIVVEGSGWDSVLGEKQDNIWISVKYASQFLQELGNDYTFLIPEKLNRQPGLVYIEDMEDRANYTAENILACYNESINSYLAENAFSSVVLLGVSEGALLLPLIYDRMNNKDNVTAMVSIGFGGLSLFEAYSILSVRPYSPPEWSEMCRDIANICDPANAEVKNTFEEDFYGITYRWFDSFRNIRPFDHYKSITIPILFVHGVADYNMPVESTVYIEKNLPEKPFEYWYYDNWDHQPRNKADMIAFRKEVSEWILLKSM